MPLTAAVTEDTLHRFCPDSGAITDGEAVLRKGAAQKPGVSADGSWLIADFKGSGKVPYQTSIDFADPAAPLGRCSCPSRRFPCKHCAALMSLYVKSPGDFGSREPSEELALKRDKHRAQVEKKGAVPAAPKKSNKSAQDKKVLSQKEGLELLEKLLVDLVSRGQWYEASRLESLERVARQLGDHHLQSPMYVIRRLVAVGSAHEERRGAQRPRGRPDRPTLGDRAARPHLPRRQARRGRGQGRLRGGHGGDPRQDLDLRRTRNPGLRPRRT